MNKNLVSLTLIFVFCILTNLVNATSGVVDCESLRDVCFQYVLKSTSDKSIDFRDYNFPYNLKLGDKIWIDSFKIINKDKIKSNEAIIRINLGPREGHIKEIYSENYGEYIFVIPPLNPKDKYEIINDEKIGGYRTFLNSYSLNESFAHWKIDLYKNGEWIITEKVEGLTSYTSIINGKFDNKLFLIQLNPLVKGFRLYKDDIKDGILILLSLFAIIVPFQIFRLELKKREEYESGIQIDLLNSIQVILNSIKTTISGHQQILNKNPPLVPSYFIPILNSNFYITRLRHKLNGISTEKLKSLLIEISNKITNINNVIKLAQEFDSQVNSDTKRNQHVKDLKYDDYYYHRHLLNLIKDLKKELDKFFNTNNSDGVQTNHISLDIRDNEAKLRLLIEHKKFEHEVTKSFLFFKVDKLVYVLIGLIGFYLVLIQIFRNLLLISTILFFIVFFINFIMFIKEIKRLNVELEKIGREIEELYRMLENK